MDNQGYTGFTFNGKHSSEFNIKRTSDGDRYNENLLPTIQDKTVQIPGADGTYFYGSYFTQRVFNVSFAFDSLTEGQLAALKAHFGDKKIHELIFDETPYKKYRAKVTGSATFKYIPFGEGTTNRVYKGEGTLQFTAYDPYARSVNKYLNMYNGYNEKDDEDKSGRLEWNDAANLLKIAGDFDGLNSDGNKIIEDKKVEFPVYNPGDKESPLTVVFAFGEESTLIPSYKIELGEQFLEFAEINKKAGSLATHIWFNSQTELVEGVREVENGRYIKTGDVYNHCITKGNFLKVPLTKDSDSETAPKVVIIPMSTTTDKLKNVTGLRYDYYYL